MTDSRPQAAEDFAPTPQQPATSALAIVALVLACLPIFLLNLVGLLLGIVALVRISGRPRLLKGKGLAIAAIVVGAAWLPILAAIAIPSFVRYQLKARQAEARVELKGAFVAQQARYAELARYAERFEELGWRPTGARQHYSFYLGDDVLPGEPRQALPAGVESFVRGATFRIAAVANLDSDPALDVWVIGETGELVNVTSDL